MSAPLIGLTGHAGAGKDSAAAVLVQAGWRAMAFGDALRVETAEAWHIDIGVLAHRASKESPSPRLALRYCTRAGFLAWAQAKGMDVAQPRSPRAVLQAWGTWRRALDPLHWVQPVEAWVRQQRRAGAPGLVITDLRMANEAAMLRECGGHLLRVHRPGLPALPPETAGHESEGHTALLADGDIHNNGDLQHLQAEVWRVVQRFSPSITHPSTTGAPHA